MGFAKNGIVIFKGDDDYPSKLGDHISDKPTDILHIYISYLFMYIYICTYIRIYICVCLYIYVYCKWQQHQLMK